MSIDLPDDLDALRELATRLLAECRRLTELNDRYAHLLQQLNRAQFGRRSERLDPDQMQLALEDIETAIAEAQADDDKKQPAGEPTGAPKKKRQVNRGALPAHLPRVHVTLAPESTACPCCQGAMHQIGEDTAERLDLIPAQYRVVVTHRPKFACRTCESAVVQAGAPERLINGGIPTEALVAAVIVDKYAWHKPLYRQAQTMALQGLPIDRSTLAGWVGAAANELKPVCQRLKDLVLGSPSIMVDETRAPVLDPGRGRTKSGYFWAIARDDRPWHGPDPPAVAYTYAPGRGTEHGADLLKDYRGIVHCDGYAVYKRLADPGRGEGGVTLAFCWLHWRRKFYEIDRGGNAPIAHQALERIAALYAIERRIRRRSADARRDARQIDTKPLVEALKLWVEAKLGEVSQKSLIAEALRYGLHHWDGLVRFLDDGRIEMDTNAVERTMRPIAMTESFCTSSSSVWKH